MTVLSYLHQLSLVNYFANLQLFCYIIMRIFYNIIFFSLGIITMMDNTLTQQNWLSSLSDTTHKVMDMSLTDHIHKLSKLLLLLIDTRV